MENQNLNTNHIDQAPLWDMLSGALIFETFRGDDVFTSTCVAIDEYTLLTAAHSAKDIDHAFIHLNFSYDQKSGERLKVDEVIIHPDYDEDKSNYLNDIAIVRLNRALPKSIKTYQIGDVNRNTSELERIGFGGRDNKNLRTWTMNQVLGVFDKYIKLEDWCSVIGDSGGPIFDTSRGDFKLVGLHSTLEGDSTTYAIRLAHYKDWIDSYTESSTDLYA